ncbi:MAG: ATP-dependent metallopeptidase FtsH/Yme1/Tma family protein, partial [candidate division Zixibacteria bacterium]|nr:ATP-dependent metallopeptidase FtsH/Yme1/Tma family protein [candidate division Zixibacteria bacterium]
MNDFDNRRDRNSGPGRPKGDPSREPSRWRGVGRPLIFWMALFLVVALIYSTLYGLNPETAEITYSEFTEQIKNGNIAEVVFEERQVSGKLKKPATFVSVNSPATFSQFKSRIPFPDDNYELIGKLEATGAKIVAKPESTGFWQIFLAFSPWIGLLFLWFIFMRQMQ